MTPAKVACNITRPQCPCTSFHAGEQDHAHDKHGAKYYMTIYAAISAGQLLMTLLNGIDVARYGQRASKSLHNAMLASLVRGEWGLLHLVLCSEQLQWLAAGPEILRNTTAVACQCSMCVCTSMASCCKCRVHYTTLITRSGSCCLWCDTYHSLSYTLPFCQAAQAAA